MHVCPDVLQVTDIPDAAPPAPAEPSEGIVGALMMVMNKRSKVIHSSGEFSSHDTIKNDILVEEKKCNV